MPDTVKKNPQNVKGILRKQLRKTKRGRPKQVEARAPTEIPVNAHPAVAKPESEGPSPFEQLEERIDDCMISARRIDADGLKEVIGLLRRARNAVVWLQGE